MDFLGIGPLELAFILLIALIVLGPKDMVKAGKTIGRTLRSIVTSENWRTIQQASKEVRDLPNKLIREAGLEDIQNELPATKEISREMGLDELDKEIQKAQDGLADWTTPPSEVKPPPESPSANILGEGEKEQETSDKESPPTQAPTDEAHQVEIDTSDIGSIGQTDIDNKTDIKDSPS
ncbi:MAG: twin-arginine translocase TatA/TatE family subunit [Anaerolineales bacterium]|jgi:Sec-independent protein translocase protein TatA